MESQRVVFSEAHDRKKVSITKARALPKNVKLCYSYLHSYKKGHTPMRYIDKEGNTLTLNECMTADSFFMEADVYIREPLEMHFNQKAELKAGKKPKKALAHPYSDSSELIAAQV